MKRSKFKELIEKTEMLMSKSIAIDRTPFVCNKIKNAFYVEGLYYRVSSHVKQVFDELFNPELNYTVDGGGFWPNTPEYHLTRFMALRLFEQHILFNEGADATLVFELVVAVGALIVE